MARLALALLLVLAPTTTAVAAQESTHSEQISVELVNVEVHVVDRDGRPVAGLTPDAFTLRDDGEPVPISHFAWIPEAGHAPHAADAVAPAEPRRIALFFDDLQAGERSRASLLDGLFERLEARLTPTDLVSVVRYDGTGLDVLLDGSADRRALRKALDALIGYSEGQLRATLELRNAIQLLRDSIERDPQTCSRTGLLLRAYSQLVLDQVQSSAGALLAYAQRFAEPSGRRVLLHVSGGVPLIAGADALAWSAERCDASALARGIPGPLPPTLDGDGVNESRGYWNPKGSRLEIAEFSTAELWSNVAARVNALGITLYPVLFGDGESRMRGEITGLMTDTAASTARHNARDTLDFLAEATGGLLVDAVADMASVDRFADDLGGYYSLAFAPTAGALSGTSHRIDVEVARKEVSVRHRQSYRLRSRDERISASLAVLLAGEPLEDPLGLDVTVLATEAPDSRRLRIVVPFARLTMIDAAEAAGTTEGRFTVYVAAQRREGRAFVPRQRSIVAYRDDSATLTYTYDILLPNSLDRIAVAVADDLSGTVGFARPLTQQP